MDDGYQASYVGLGKKWGGTQMNLTDTEALGKHNFAPGTGIQMT